VLECISSKINENSDGIKKRLTEQISVKTMAIDSNGVIYLTFVGEFLLTSFNLIGDIFILKSYINRKIFFENVIIPNLCFK
jgi:hypothetical protein